MNIKYLLTFLLYLAATIYPIRAQQIEIRLSLEKDQYLRAEPIFLELQLVNNSQDSIVVDNWDFVVRMVVLDNSGEKYTPGLDFYRIKPLRSNFGPGDVFNYHYNISGLFGRGDSVFPWSHFPVGEYTVYIENYRVYKGLDERRPKRAPFGIPYRSNTVHFLVVEPEGDEVTPFEMLRQAYRYRDEKDDRRAYELFNKIADRFPNSVYSTRALYRAGKIFKFYKEINLQDQSVLSLKRLLMEYPESDYAREAKSDIVIEYRTRNDREGLIRILEEVINANPGSAAAFHAEKSLEWVRTAPEDEFDLKKVSERIRREMKESQKKLRRQK